MKYLLIFITFINTQSYGQNEFHLNSDRQQWAMLNYVSENFDSIVKYTSADSLFISITFNQYDSTIKSVEYFKSILLKKKDEVFVWNEFRNFIKKIFNYYPIGIQGRLLGKKTFFIYLEKDDLEKNIKRCELRIDELFDNIQPNAKFKILINEIYFDKYVSIPDTIRDNFIFIPLEIKNKIHQSKLEYLNSGIILLDKNWYLTINVSNTSKDGKPESEIELNIYSENKLVFNDMKKINIDSSECHFLTESFPKINQESKKFCRIDIKIEFD